MCKPAMDLSGRQFGKWFVLRRAESVKSIGRQFFWECQCACGARRQVVGQSLRNGASASCGCSKRDGSGPRGARKGSKNPRWKGGNFITSSGYVRALCPEHPRAAKSYVLEHILIMEKKIGRSLLPEETIHHKNGIRHDNTLNNLELWASHHPPGQRVEDLVQFAKEILRIYEPQSTLTKTNKRPKP